ncbi:hypothetical protein SAMN05444398_11325 [Roseovarius pacificus]|uniref:Sulfotransferase family protein n=1 Tax=Roseovarius pacificus TaxID=337701 RepID=A0A1M7HMI4_9RHOB|nr:hypothetical protein GCM10011315_35560 [Roseovarius pacificus]SHM29650.1 hypothetical protein SAMN05444398_11325 [Roseovarius pacificus]
MTGDCVLKIYGERNSGTNYLQDLASKNLYAQVLSGRAPDRHPQAYVAKALKLISKDLGMRYRHAWRDRYLANAFDAHLGWKHACPSPERLGPDRLASVRFAMIVKNPYAWLLSMFRRPYHIGAQDKTFEAFLNRKVPVMPAMENIGTDQIGPVEVWNRKIAGYFVLKDAAAHACIVNYENFLQDEEGALRHMAQGLDIRQRPDFVSITRGAKGDAEVNRQHYVDYYMHERWRKKLSPKLVDMINSQLDGDLVSRMGYEVISPDTL